MCSFLMPLVIPGSAGDGCHLARLLLLLPGVNVMRIVPNAARPAQQTRVLVFTARTLNA